MSVKGILVEDFQGWDVRKALLQGMMLNLTKTFVAIDSGNAFILIGLWRVQTLIKPCQLFIVWTGMYVIEKHSVAVFFRI
jgi:hypothetical protein